MNEEATSETGETANAPNSGGQDGGLRNFGGSSSGPFNAALVKQALNGIWFGNLDDEEQERRYQATLHALAGIAPGNEIEAMLAALRGDA